MILGATGSVGSGAVDVVRANRDSFRVVAVSSLVNREGVDALAREFGARAYCGEGAGLRAVEENPADVVLVATVGLSGLLPTMAAIAMGEDVALATKEVMVAAGALVTAKARERGVRILPVDSEHSAIFQCLQSRGRQEIDRLTLTASGGPFLSAPADLSEVTPEMALRHPRWKMGRKVTVDSSTLMNKGFEIVEARWLFDVPVDRIDVVVHPQSAVHSLVTFTDGSTLAQLAPPDMRIPIQYALSWPDRLPARRERLDLAALARLDFMLPDESRFPCLRLVKEAAAAGGTKAAALSAADEVAVSRFLAGDIRYVDVPALVERVVASAPDVPCDCVDSVLAVDSWARSAAASMAFRR